MGARISQNIIDYSAKNLPNTHFLQVYSGPLLHPSKLNIIEAMKWEKRFGFRIDSNYYSMLIESSGIQLVFIPMNSGTYLK